MARIRTTKPEFWCSEQIINCSRDARLMFIGLWNFCDDAGVHPASYVRLKAEVFPWENFSIDDIKRLVAELIGNDLLREYFVDEKSYWIVTGWSKHQKIDKPTYRHPPPQSDLKKLTDHSTNNPRNLDDNSANNRRLVDESSPPEWNGKEGNGKGKEDNTCKVSDETLPCVVFKNHSVASNDVQEIFSYWQAKMNHPRAVLDPNREKIIAHALKLGYSKDDLKQAIDGCANTPFYMWKNDRNKKYDDFKYIFRDASKIEEFIENAINPPSETTVNQSKNNIMLGVI